MLSQVTMRVSWVIAAAVLVLTATLVHAVPINEEEEQSK